MAIQHVLVFGDQAVEKLPSIRNLISISKTSPSLRRFLQEATDVIHAELSHATPSERSAFGEFDDAISLAEFHATQENPDEVVGATLITIERLGELIIYAEADPSILHGIESCVHQLGLCTGMLAASVAAVATDTSEVFKYGLEIVAISFRLALEVNRRSKRVEQTPRSWACTLIGPTTNEVQKVLDVFNDQNGIPIARHAYIGVSSRTWTTLFGPPSVLDKLWAQPNELRLTPKLRLPAAAAVHARHLPPVDAYGIIGNSPLLNIRLPTKASMISSSTCKPFEATTLRELLVLIIADVAQHRLQMEGVIQGLVAHVGRDAQINLTVVGPTPHTSLVQKALQSAGSTVNLVDSVRSPMSEQTRMSSDLIAIVGVAGRFPGSDTLEDFWESLLEGEDTHQQIPESRFNLDDFYDPTGTIPHSILTKFGCFLENPGVFDNRFFGISPREALQMDPLQRLLLMTTYEAMEMAGYAQNGSVSTRSSRIATYFGQTTEDWRSINDQQGIDIYYLPGSNRAFAPGRLNYHFKWGGGYYNLDSACSSSSTAVLLARSALISRECDTAVVGGGNILTIPEMYSGLSKGGFLSPTGASKTFSNSADGYCRGEGVGVVVLKRIEDAIRDNDNVLAVLRGAARNSNTKSASITYPDAISQEALLTKLLQQSAVDPQDVGFIEMHGTGTQAGDTVEMSSVMKVFAEKRSQDDPLFVGAIKANIGHGEAAAGISSLIKTVLMLKHDAIPPQPGFPFEINHKFPRLVESNVRIADGKSLLRPRYNGDGKRKLIVNNFDAAGGNTSLLIEEAPLQEARANDPRPYHVVVCSAHTLASLTENKRRLRDHLINNEGIRPADLAYTTTARRLHGIHREAYVTQSVEQLVESLNADISQDEPSHRTSSGRNSVVFAFTGQGSHYSGMGRKLFHSLPSFRRMIESYEELCIVQGLPSFIDLIRDARIVETKSTVQVQLAIVSLEVALAKLWQSWGVEPSLLIGHSLGEYAALCIAEVLSVSDTLYLVGRRALLIQERCVAGTHTMLATALSSAAVQELLDNGTSESYEIACFNGPSLTVISGTVGDINLLQQRILRDGSKATLLEVPYGFHSSQMDTVLQDYEAIAVGVNFASPMVPIASTLTATVVRDRNIFNGRYLAQQARNPVNFLDAMRNCQAQGLINDQSVFLEIGPQPVCLGLVRSCINIGSSRLLHTFKRDDDDWKGISTSIAAAYLARAQVNWSEFHKDYIKYLRLLELPSYAFELKNYWVPYTRPKSSLSPAVNSSIQTAAPTLLTTCLQRIEVSSFTSDKVHVVFASNTSEPSLYNAIQGHSVSGIAICPASIFIDMAYTAAKYIWGETNHGVPTPPVELNHLEITSPLVVSKNDSEQIVRVTASMSAGGSRVHIIYSSSSGSTTADHAECWVDFGDNSPTWKPEWDRIKSLLQRRVGNLMMSPSLVRSHRLVKPLVYRLFSSVVNYSIEYQVLEEVFLDGEFNDAAAIVKLHSLPGLGSFSQNPYWTDAIVHLAGFISNGNFSKAEEDIYISNGLENLRIIGNLSVEQEYICYASTRHNNEKGLSLCDVYLYHEDILAAICTGIRFQKMTKKIFSLICQKAAAQREDSRQGTTMQAMETAEGSTSASETSLRTNSDSVAQATLQNPQNESTAILTPVSDTSSAVTPSAPSILLKMISSETGVGVKEIVRSTSFAEIGVDSIMSIAILSAFQKETGIELPAAFFNTFSTVGEAQDEPKPTIQAELVTTPLPSIAAPNSSPKTTLTNAKTSSLTDQLLSIVSTEAGVSADELLSCTEFASIGIDSLLSISILAVFKKQTGHELPAAFFNTFLTVAEVREELDGKAQVESVKSTEIRGSEIRTDASPTPAIQRRGNRTGDVQADGLRSNGAYTNQVQSNGIDVNDVNVNKKQINGDQENKPSTKSVQINQVSMQYPPHQSRRRLRPKIAITGLASDNTRSQSERHCPVSRAILIQGRSKSTEAPLFLITDGSGSVTAYIHFPSLPEGRRIYALESPFLEKPEEYTRSIPEVADMFLATIRKVQPHGPYMIGGWSAGGVFAYEVSRKLLADDERVLGLLIMDMRVPHGIPDALEPTMEFLEQTGLMVGVKRSGSLLDGISQSQKVHLLMTLKALVNFEPKPMEANQRPNRTFIVWATKGLNETADEDDRKGDITGPASMGTVGSAPGELDHMRDPEAGLKSWFFAKRYTFGPNGWEKLVGDNIECHKVDADHFSMVAKPLVKDLGTLVLKAVDNFTLDESPD